ncbi:MAG: NAD-dependent epimerase/dehydratase family protein [Beijerinckiaceae bacterium]
MSTTIFLAGATGAIGRQLTPLLVEVGYRVFGTTRVMDRARVLQAAGAEPVTLDVFDVPAVEAAFSRIRPEILIHEITDLPQRLDREAMIEGEVRNARVWSEGTRNLMKAAKNAGTRRAIAQSLAWLYAPGPEPHREEDVLGVTDADSRVVLEGVLALEHAVLDTAPVEGIVLRYGLLYGPGTSSEQPQGPCHLHVQAAAHAALLAIEKGRPGAYNVADDNTFVSTAKARQELGWDPAFRRLPR